MGPKPTAADKERMDSIEANLETLQTTIQAALPDDVRRVEGCAKTVRRVGARWEVQKIIFEPVQKAMPKLGNYLKMAKSGNVFVKPTLELNSRSTKASRVQRPLPQ
ncbi:unnamed protein product [Linum trigynum]|uniref:Uncharacterized protein n=1 Tax=Linum trigynum TaxID=586398 RepID=A0AAV2F4Z6_9ROSI